MHSAARFGDDSREIDGDKFRFCRLIELRFFVVSPGFDFASDLASDLAPDSEMSSAESCSIKFEVFKKFSISKELIKNIERKNV